MGALWATFLSPRDRRNPREVPLGQPLLQTLGTNALILVILALTKGHLVSNVHTVLILGWACVPWSAERMERIQEMLMTTSPRPLSDSIDASLPSWLPPFLEIWSGRGDVPCTCCVSVYVCTRVIFPVVLCVLWPSQMADFPWWEGWGRGCVSGEEEKEGRLRGGRKQTCVDLTGLIL